MPSPPHTGLSDRELLARFQTDRDNTWLGILLERYTLLLYGVCMKYLKDPEEARDAVQQIFLKVILELQKYEVTYFSSWLYMIAKNHCLMKLRHPMRAVPVTEQTGPATDDDEESDNRLVEWRLEQLEEALTTLNPAQKRCVELFYLNKKSYQDISGITGYSLLQVKSYIQNGKRNLRLTLEKKSGKS